ncbi:stromelysin-3-like [Branchiostoma floridae]|uniref:Stromelysin-3-like n=1 Tax=Branchiostoma floridae TaxID=7739 RepID=A0A9J7M0D4_BRAFL|nr:stromelysin-3-like [Branchiostoma floridae]
MAVVRTTLLLMPLALWLSVGWVGGNQEAMWPGAGSILNVTNADLSKGVDYLMKFGYLKQDGKMRTGEDLREAIITMQRFGGLEETGKLDEGTLKLMQSPRCGVADIIGTAETTRKKRYALVGYYWQKKNLTYRIVRTTPQLSPYVVHDAIRRAFNVWSDVTPLTFTEMFHGEADIMIDFLWGFHGDGNPFDGPGNTLAHAFFPGPRRGGDTHFDEEEKWTMTKEGANLFQVATHEFGHALGLGHSSEHNTIMGPFYRYRDPLQLTEDDIRGIQQLYGAPEEKARPKQPLTPVVTQEPRYPPKRPDHVPNTPEQPPRRPPVHTPDRHPHTPNHPETPVDTCFSSIDAVAVIRSELFVFKDRHFYRYHDKGLYPGYPAMTSRFWRSLPRGVHVDAVYERYDGKIVFFKGSEYWVFDGNYLESRFPRPIRDYGLYVQSVDAAFVWGHNGKTYFFKGNRYWRYDDIEKKMDRGYPKKIDRWEGVPNNLDGIMQWTDGLTYFFKGSQYWKFNDITMRVEDGYPRSAPHDWFGCRKVLNTPNDRDPEEEDPFSGEEPNDQPSTSGGNRATLNLYTVSTALLSLVISVCVWLL